jgi:ecotin
MDNHDVRTIKAIRNRLLHAIVASSLFLLSNSVLSATPDLKLYPLAESGYKRLVIQLRPLKQETNNKLEIILGKTFKVDCNKHWFNGKLSEEVLQGWGYPYFVLKDLGGPLSTRMACLTKQKPKEAFVPVQSEQNLIPYNSQLPIVVYVPTDFEVHYRIWTASAVLRVE